MSILLTPGGVSGFGKTKSAGIKNIGQENMERGVDRKSRGGILRQRTLEFGNFGEESGGGVARTKTGESRKAVFQANIGKKSIVGSRVTPFGGVSSTAYGGVSSSPFGGMASMPGEGSLEDYALSDEEAEITQRGGLGLSGRATFNYQQSEKLRSTRYGKSALWTFGVDPSRKSAHPDAGHFDQLAISGTEGQPMAPPAPSHPVPHMQAPGRITAAMFEEDHLRSLLGDLEPGLIERINEVYDEVQKLFTKLDYDNDERVEREDVKALVSKIWHDLGVNVDSTLGVQEHESNEAHKYLDFHKFVDVFAGACQKAHSDPIGLARMDQLDRQRTMRERFRKRESNTALNNGNGLPGIMPDMRRKSFAPGKTAHQDHHHHRGAGNEDASDGTVLDPSRRTSQKKIMPMGRTRASIRGGDMFGDGLFAAEADEPLKVGRQSIMVGRQSTLSRKSVTSAFFAPTAS